jgi:6-phosphogluconolactonase
MPYFVFVALAGEDNVLILRCNTETGKIESQTKVAVLGAPAMLATDPQNRFLFVGCNTKYYRLPNATNDGKFYSYQINNQTGDLKLLSTISLQNGPAFLTMDGKGKFLLSAHYYAGKVAVHPVSDDGRIGAATQWINTGGGAHSILSDPSNKFVFVPHLAPTENNKNNWVNMPSADYILSPASNTILQFKLDEIKGNLTLNSPDRVVAEAGVGPRHLCFHPNKGFVYFTNETGSSVTAYHLNLSSGTLKTFQTVSSIPESYGGKNSCSSLRITNCGRFVYVLNRGHNSVACFSTDPKNGRLKFIKTFSTEENPRELSLDPENKFLFVVGGSGRMASYRVIVDTGELVTLETYPVGKNPMWVLITKPSL